MDYKLAVIQHKVGFDKKENMERAARGIREGVEKGAQIVVLPEMFNCPYANDYFPEYAESYPRGETYRFLQRQATEHGIYLVGGSVPEKEGESLYNTSFVFGPDGSLLGRHRKMHLFDINVPGKIYFKESDTLSPGEKITLIDTEFGKIGVAICYDVRFPEMFRVMALKGVRLVVIPGAFNMTTGPAHWELLLRARAVDNQIYVAAASPSRDTAGVYTAWGHSMIVDPWGEVVVEAGSGEEVLVADIESAQIERVRQRLPVYKHLKQELYK
ncbi:MAG: Nitrilase/cyanide hydratase and apolipoprotein N-acyltransferase [Clostridiales bacterium]|jgi:omega-amidase|nr:Nitrilase/cyanide hydratase and apolipoprotein N-acyltransferase [Clostridiales bacterium]